MGGLFYLPLYTLFGLDPLPYRIACFLFLTVNLGLAWRLVQLLTGSAETASLSTLIGAFHPRLVDLYWSTGTIYDILCFMFFSLAFCLYLEIRNEGRVPGRRAALLILILFVCALNSKEMAVALPPLMLVYEFLFHGASFREALTQARVPLIAGAMTLPYIWGKLMASSPLAQLDSYHPVVSPLRLLQTYGSYLDELLYMHSWFTPQRTGVLLVMLLLVGLALRSRVLIFSWCFAIVSALPVAFIPPRAAFAFYIPLTGWTIYIASLVVQLRIKLFGRSQSEVYRFVTLFAVLCLLLRAHRIQRDRMGGPEILGQAMIRHVAADLEQHHPVFPRGARVLAVNDPFTAARFDLVLLLRLYAHDPHLNVDHAAADDCTYDVVLQWNGTKLEPIRNKRC